MRQISITIRSNLQTESFTQFLTVNEFRCRSSFFTLRQVGLSFGAAAAD